MNRKKLPLWSFNLLSNKLFTSISVSKSGLKCIKKSVWHFVDPTPLGVSRIIWMTPNKYKKRNSPFLHRVPCDRVNSHFSQEVQTFGSKIVFKWIIDIRIQVEIGLIAIQRWLKNFLNTLAAPKWKKGE